MAQKLTSLPTCSYIENRVSSKRAVYSGSADLLLSNLMCAWEQLIDSEARLLIILDGLQIQAQIFQASSTIRSMLENPGQVLMMVLGILDQLFIGQLEACNLWQLGDRSSPVLQVTNARRQLHTSPRTRGQRQLGTARRGEVCQGAHSSQNLRPRR